MKKTSRRDKHGKREPLVEFLNRNGFAFFLDRFATGGWDVNPVVEFFNCLMLVIDEDLSFSEHIKEISMTGAFKSFEDAERFVEVYGAYYNSVVALLEYLEAADDHGSTMGILDGLADAFMAFCSTKNTSLSGVLGEAVLSVAGLMMKHAGIDPDAEEIRADLLAERMDEVDMQRFSYLMFAHAETRKDSPSRDDLVKAMQTVIMVATTLNAERKSAYEDTAGEVLKPKRPKKSSRKKPRKPL